MLNHKKTSAEAIEKLLQEGVFSNLTLTTNGNLFADPGLATKADWFWFYHQGSFYGRNGGRFQFLGEKPKTTVTFPVLAGQIAVFPVEDAGYFLRTLEPVVGEGQTFFSVFQCQGVLALVIAVGAISRSIYLTILEQSDEEEMHMKNYFIDLLRRSDPKLVTVISNLV